MIKSDLETISKLFSSTVNEIVADHFPAHTQEHQLSSRIGQRLEDRFNGFIINGRSFSVITQDMPDKGPGSLEKKTGVDLFISISVDGPDGFDKGILVQSKWKDKAFWSDLSPQCKTMLERSKSSYAWLYGPSGVTVIDAKKLSGGAKRILSDIPSRRLDTVVKRILNCLEGDHTLGIPPTKDRRVLLSSMLDQWNVEYGINLTVSKPYESIPEAIPVAPRRPLRIRPLPKN